MIIVRSVKIWMSLYFCINRFNRKTNLLLFLLEGKFFACYINFLLVDSLRHGKLVELFDIFFDGLYVVVVKLALI